MRSTVSSRPIAVVDDSADDVEIITRCFQRSDLATDFEIRPFETGSAFLDHMGQVEKGIEPNPIIVLLDINMPGMDGFEVLRSLRSLPTFKSTPRVVFMSNTDRVEDLERAVTMGSIVVPKFGTIGEGVAFFDNLTG